MTNLADNHSKEERSYNMSRIRGQDNKPEELVRKFLFSKGLRYRKNDKRYPGHPDIVLPKYRTVIFINGCFWHMHDGCKYAVMPTSNKEYWEPKLRRNKQRDTEVQQELANTGWRVIIIWECQLKKDKRETTLEKLYNNIIASKDEVSPENRSRLNKKN